MDQQIEILINRSWTAPWADHFFSSVQNYGAWIPLLLVFVLVVLVFGDFKFRAALLAVGLAVGLSDGIGVNLLKHAVARPRPSQVEPGVRFVDMGKPPAHCPQIAGVFSEPKITFPNGTNPPQIPGALVKPGEKGRSFPSGHAANNMAAATVLILFYRRWGWLYLPVALLVCYARIYTGSHWPLDVAAGILLGILGGTLSVSLLRFLWSRWGARLFPKQFAKHPDLTV